MARTKPQPDDLRTPRKAKNAARVKRRKPASDRVESLVKVLVTKAEREQLEAAADRSARTLSSWARLTLVRAAEAAAGSTAGPTAEPPPRAMTEPTA